MIKFVAEIVNGNLYGFGLTEANLNRLEFNNEPIFFNFDYAGIPSLFGLILYLGQYKEPIEISQDIETVKTYCLPFLNSDRGVTPQSLRMFPIAQSTMQKFRATPFWAFDTQIEISKSGDKQMFFAGRDERDIEEYFRANGLISRQTKCTYKGFGKR